MTVRLPKDPKDDQYEDLITACILGLGYFVESNLHLREESTEVLELDVVATPVDDPRTGTVLLEAKSGSSRYEMVGSSIKTA